MTQPAAWPDAPGALNEAKLASREARDLLAEPIQSGINPNKAFAPREYLTLVDAATWEMRVVVNALAEKLGLDPAKIVADAVKKDRGE